MNWQKKLTKLFSVIFLMMLLAACDGNYCVEAEEFDNNFVQVDSNPISDGIFGASYDHVNGGQTASWHETGLRANGKPFIIQISGAWIPWYGSAVTNKKLNNMKRCNFCAKRHNVASENCICYDGQEPKAEPSLGGPPQSVDCNIPANQNDPTKCSCTKLNGKTTDEGVFHFPLNFYEKDHSIKLPDDQGAPCKYNGGMGLFLGLFGTSGNEAPIRAYHLFSEATTCSINRNSDGECKDEFGVDKTKYIFRSANNTIFVKDDLSGNNATNATLDDDVYHRPNEFVKLIIHDRYYSDNYGKYNIIFLQGVSRDGDTGLLEFLVRILEDALLGKPDINLERQGGILKYMYQGIVQDSYFGAALQISLSLYIAFFGFATLLGIVEITKKELLNRLLKLSLVIFFTTPTSWYWYNQIIVTFFKDGMNTLITMFSEYVVANLDEDAPIRIAQAVSESPTGESSRFSYIDIMIKTLFSDNVTKKIWGLFFESFFGFVYIAAIYALIGFFIYVMLLAAMVYMVTILKLIFVLALGPIFIVFSLFGQTNAMFKNWLGFVGARSLEMVILFLVLYTFVMFIDEKFVQLLQYRVCTQSINFGFFSFGILMAESGRGIGEWIQKLLMLGAYIYILMEITKKIPDLAGQLISIGGVANNDGNGNANNSSAVGMASKMLNAAGGLAMSGIKTGLSEGGGQGFRLARLASRSSGLSGAIDSVANKIPLRGPRTRLRDNIIDTAIKKGQADATAKGFSKGTAEYDRAVRDFAMNDKREGILAFKNSNPKQAALYDMDNANIAKRLDSQLVKEPLKDFLKEEAQRIKNRNPHEIPLGKDMEKELQAAARKWAEKSLVGGSDSANSYLGTDTMKSLIKKKGKLSDDEAAKKFAGNEDMKNKFLQYKQERAMEKASNLSTRLQRGIEKRLGMETGQTGKNFMRKVGYEEQRTGDWRDAIGLNTGKGLNPLKRVDWMDKLRDKSALNEATRAAMEKAMGSYLKKGGYEDEKARINALYQEKAKGSEDTFYGRQLLGRKDKNGNMVGGKLQKELDNLEAKREMFKKTLLDKVSREREGKTEDELDKMRAQAASELEDMRAKHMAAAGGDLSEIRANGGAGLAGLRDGLTDFDGNSLLEAEMRAKSLGLLDGDKSASSAAAGDATNMIDANSHKFSVEFGAELSDAIGLQVGNVGLQAADPFGLAKEEASKRDEALIGMRNAMKVSSEREAKAKTYEKAEKQLALSNLQKDPDAKTDLQKQKQINDLERDVSRLDGEAKDAKIKADNFQKDVDFLSNS